MYLDGVHSTARRSSQRAACRRIRNPMEQATHQETSGRSSHEPPAQTPSRTVSAAGSHATPHTGPGHEHAHSAQTQGSAGTPACLPHPLLSEGEVQRQAVTHPSPMHSEPATRCITHISPPQSRSFFPINLEQVQNTASVTRPILAFVLPCPPPCPSPQLCLTLCLKVISDTRITRWPLQSALGTQTQLYFFLWWTH